MGKSSTRSRVFGDKRLELSAKVAVGVILSALEPFDCLKAMRFAIRAREFSRMIRYQRIVDALPRGPACRVLGVPVLFTHLKHPIS